MSSRKRSREEDLLIKTAAGEPIPAEGVLVRACSSCAKALPADAEQWDVSGFLYEGQPFSRETVKAWVSCAYSALDGPSDLEAEDQQQLCTASSLHQLLCFAQAVGSRVALLQAACSQMRSLRFVVPLPEQTLELMLAAEGKCGFNSSEPHQLAFSNISTFHEIGSPLASEQQCSELQRQLATQVASLLHMAHVLRLQQLIDALHSFVFWNTAGVKAVLYGVLDLVFTDAVCVAALGSGTLNRETYINSVISQPCKVSADDSVVCFCDLFRLLGDAKKLESGELEFDAVLLQDFGGCSAGTQVQGRADTLGQSHHGIYLRHEGMRMWLPLQLSLGFSITAGYEPDPSILNGRLQ